MDINQKYGVSASDASINNAAAALNKNNIATFIVGTGEEARQKLLELLPQGAEVMNMTSATLDAIGAAKEIMESGKYNSVRKQLLSMDRKTQGREMQKLGAAPDWAVGSVHAVTEDGKVLIASATGSQLSAYAAGAGHVVWVVSSQKIVPDLEEGMKRIYEYSFPLEDVRAQKVYGVHSSVNHILVIHKEPGPGRATMIIVKEKLGF